MTHRNATAAWSIAVTAMLVLFTTEVLADRLARKPIEYGPPSSAPLHTYADVRFPEGKIRKNSRRTQIMDINVWGYTEAFKSRLGMPERWLAPRMIGIAAAAWRYEENAVWQCGFDKDPDDCRQESHCRMDTYLTDETWMYWIDDTASAPTLSREHAARFLVAQNDSDRAAKADREMTRAHALGVISYRYEGRTGIESGEIEIAEYRRELLEGLAFVSLDVPCSLPLRVKQGSDVDITIHSPRTDTPHEIRLPFTYVSRIAEYQADKPDPVDAPDGEGESGDYGTWFSKAGWEARGRQGTYTRDPHIWIYSRRFAERFGMPREWIDDRLQGAEALAYRIDWSTQFTCGYFGQKDACYKYFRRVLDLFLDEAEPVPWGGYYEANAMFRREHSHQLIFPQNGRDWTRKRALTFDHIREREIGRVQDTRVVRKGVWPIVWNDFEMVSSNLNPYAYRKRMLPALDFIGLKASFQNANRGHGRQLWFRTPLIAPENKTYHIIDIPMEFVRRIQDYNDSFDQEDPFFEALESSLRN